MSIRLRDARGSCYDKILMTLKAYLDDSGKLSDPYETVAVVGGCIATVDEWDRLEPEWFGVIEKYGVREFHATDLEYSRRDYYGWSKDKTDSFSNELLGILRKHVRMPSKPIGALLPKSQFLDLSNEEQLRWGGDPYYACLQHSIELAAKHAYDLYNPPENVEIFCDEQPGFEGVARQVYWACRNYLPDILGDRLSGIGFHNSTKLAGLQVADLIAYECLKLRREMIAAKDDLIDKIRPRLDQLLSYQCDFEFFNPGNLWERTPLINYGQ